MNDTTARQYSRTEVSFKSGRRMPLRIEPPHLRQHVSLRWLAAVDPDPTVSSVSFRGLQDGTDLRDTKKSCKWSIWVSPIPDPKWFTALGPSG